MNFLVTFPDNHQKNTFLSIVSRCVDYPVKFLEKGKYQLLLVDLPIANYWKLKSMVDDEYPLFRAFFEIA